MIKLMKRTTVKRCTSKTLATFIAVALMISVLSVPVFAAQTKSETYPGNDGNYGTIKFAPVNCTGYFVGYQKVSSGILP